MISITNSSCILRILLMMEYRSQLEKNIFRLKNGTHFTSIQDTAPNETLLGLLCCQLYKLINQHQSKDGDIYFHSSCQHIQHVTSFYNYI
jgi:hypothetical protein